MTRYHATINGNIPFTQEEEDLADDIQSELEAEAPGLAETETRAKINEERDRILATGFEYTFHDGQGIVEIRNPDDKAFISGLLSTSSDMIRNYDFYSTAGFYIDKDDNRHDMNANQAKAFCTVVLDWISSMYSVANEHKVSISAIKENSEFTNQEKVNAINAYDFSIGWDYYYNPVDYSKTTEYKDLLKMRVKKLQSEESVDGDIKALNLIYERKL